MEHNPKQNRSAFTLICLFIVFIVIIGGAGIGIGYYLNLNAPEAELSLPSLPAQPSPAVSIAPPSPSPAEPSEPSDAAPAASVDRLLSIREVFLLGDLSAVAIAGAGSGFILSENGYILTNHHVVENAASVTVILHDGSEHPAEIIGSDPVIDVAVIRIKAEGLHAVKIGSSDAIMVGDQVVAIGNPLGELTNSLTVGYISGKMRTVYIEGAPHLMLQTDAAVSPGNSGGPLFNLYGEVIGVVTAKAVGSDVEGIGFAIPINSAARIAEELIEYGEITGRPLLGVTYRDVISDDGEDLPRGVFITEVAEDSPASRGGLLRDDIITVFNNKRVTGGAQLLLALNERRVGDVVTVTIVRGGEELELTVSLDTARDGRQPSTPRR
jgi:serine protease Do